MTQFATIRSLVKACDSSDVRLEKTARTDVVMVTVFDGFDGERQFANRSAFGKLSAYVVDHSNEDHNYGWVDCYKFNSFTLVIHYESTEF